MININDTDNEVKIEARGSSKLLAEESCLILRALYCNQKENDMDVADFYQAVIEEYVSKFAFRSGDYKKGEGDVIEKIIEKKTAEGVEKIARRNKERGIEDLFGEIAKDENISEEMRSLFRDLAKRGSRQEGDR